MDTKIAVPNIPSIGVCVNQHVNKTQKVDRFLQEETGRVYSNQSKK